MKRVPMALGMGALMIHILDSIEASGGEVGNDHKEAVREAYLEFLPEFFGPGT